MPSIEYPSVPLVPAKRLYAFVWALIFFVCINAGVVGLFANDRVHQRISYYAPYEEMHALIEAIKQDKRKKVVFIGGSIMWGSETPDASQTIPVEFARLLPPDVVVYNLSVVSIRPLDQALLAYLVKDHADLIITDYNYEFGLEVERERLQRDRQTFLRMLQLFSVHGDTFLADIPEVRICMDTFGISLPAILNETEEFNWAQKGERALLPFVQRFIPIYRYKDLINESIFGRHPRLLVEEVGFHMTDIVRGQITLKKLLSSPVPTVEPQPWTPDNTDGERGYIARLQTRFPGQSVHTCIMTAFSDYAAEMRMPLVGYIAPLNPAMLPGFASTPTYEANMEILQNTFSPMLFFGFAPERMTGDLFVDGTHLTAEGNKALAEQLFEVLTDNDAL